MKRFLLFLLLVVPINLFGQVENINEENSTNQSFWLKLGPGIYNDRDDGGLSLYGSLTIQQKHMYKFRVIYNEELLLFENPERFTDIGILFGVSKTYQWTKVSAYGGLGIVKGKMRGDFISYGSGGWFSPSEYDWDSFTTVGIPLELEFSVLPHQLLGVGFSIFGNINSANSMGGIIVKFEIGK